VNARRINNLAIDTTVAPGFQSLLVSKGLSHAEARVLATASNASMWGVGTVLGTAGISVGKLPCTRDGERGAIIGAIKRSGGV